ncbi:MAG: solute carrier family 23 protein [Eubacteriales bacterium]|nr:solute carrier family 23 protein [Eubacteriales bacterium]
MANSPHTELFKFEGRPALGQAIPLALQHVVAMIAGCITPALIVSGSAGLADKDKVILVQMSLVMAGIATLIQLFPLFGRVGARLPVIIGVSFAYVPTMAAIAKQYAAYEQFGPTGAVGVILGAQLIGGIVAVVFGLFVKKLVPLFPPLVTGTVVFVIGLSLYPIAIRYMGGAGSVKAPGWGNGKAWAVALITFAVAIILNNFTKGIFKMASVLFAMIFGYLVSIPFGLINLESVNNASWFAIAKPLHFGLHFEVSAIISFIILFIVNSIQAIGDFTATTIGGMDRVPTDKELQGGIVGYGITNILGSVTGCLPFSTFSQNVGIVSTNRVISRMVFAIAAVVISVAGLIPKFSSILTTIPYPVIGGATISVFAMITMGGVRLIAKQPLTPRNTTVVGLSVAFGMGFTTVCGEANAAGNLWLPSWLYTAIGTSPVVLATILAVVLNLIIKAKPSDLAE